MTGDSDEPLGVRQLLVRVLVVPGLVVALALGLVMAVINALQHGAPAASAHRQVALSATGAARRATPRTPPHRRGWTTTPPAAASSTRTPPHAAARVRAADRRAHVPPVGAYVGSGDLDGASQLSAALPGGLAGVLDYVDAGSWSTIADPSWLLDRWAPTRDPLILAVPMLPASGASLATGATGAYDGEFRQLARLLVADGEATATLVLGWSPLDPGLPWTVTQPAGATAYVAYFRHIVDTMRLVPGARFRFAFEPGPSGPEAIGPGAMGPGHLYPGNAYVDDIATQIFNRLPTPVGPASRWARVAAVPYGPDWVARFAARLHRRLIVTGLALVPAAAGGGGDDPAFVRSFFAWARQARVASVTLWSQGTWAFTPANDPHAFALLRTIVSGASG